jgi:retron-type reverse transcriptase
MEIKEELIDKILQPANLTMACKEVVRNKGAGGVDSMKVSELEAYLHEHRTALADQIRKGNYHAQPIRGKEPSEASS